METLDIAAVTAEGLNQAESFTPCKMIGFILKIVAFLATLISGALALDNNLTDLRVYRVDPRYVIQSGNETYSAQVDVKGFSNAFSWFCVFYAIDLVVSLTMIVCEWTGYQAKYLSGKLSWFPVAVFIELPMMGCEAWMLESRGIINFDDQKVDMVLHIVYVLKIPIHLLFTLLLNHEVSSCKSCCKGLLLTLFCFFFACFLYAPILMIMYGGLNWWFTIDDFGKIKLTGVTLNIMKFLVNLGNVGQFVWILLLICCGLNLSSKSD